MIVEIIKSCVVMISLNYSTVVLDAMILQKPTMTLLPEEQGFEKEDFITKEATLYEPDIIKLELGLNNLLNNEKFRQKLIDKGNEFLTIIL